MTVNTVTPGASHTDSDTSHAWDSTVIEPRRLSSEADASADEKPKKSPAKKVAAKKAKTLELTMTVTSTADGEWRAQLTQGTSYLARNLAVTATAVSRAAKELHEALADLD